MVKISRVLKTMFLSHTFLLVFLVVRAITESSDSPLHELANASAGSPDNGFQKLYSKIDALERTVQNLETNVLEKATRMDTLMRKVLITFNEIDAKSETSNLDNLSVERKKTLVEYVTDTPVGFTARLMGVYSNTFTNIESYMILYNQGGAYNGTVFTCPSPGLYLFQVSVITFSVNNGIRMYTNFQQLTLAFSGASPQANGASVSAATWLDIGDEVYLRPYNSSLDVDFNSVFTGVKII